MSDLGKRLREWPPNGKYRDMREAADEIERLTLERNEACREVERLEDRLVEVGMERDDARAEVVRCHMGDCWHYLHEDGLATEKRVLSDRYHDIEGDGTCPICRAVIGAPDAT